jgi:hypothetical protein
MIIYKSEVVMIRCHSTRPHIISKDEWQHQHGHGHYSGMVSVCSYGYNWRYHWDCKLMNANTSDVILFSFLPSLKKNYVPLHNIALLVKSNHEHIKRNHEHILKVHYMFLRFSDSVVSFPILWIAFSFSIFNFCIKTEYIVMFDKYMVNF